MLERVLGPPLRRARALLGALPLPTLPRHHDDAPCAAQRLLDQSCSFYVAMDQDGVVLRWNDAATRLFGYGAQEALGRPVTDLVVPPSSQAAHGAGIEWFLRTGRGRGIGDHVEVDALRADGTLVPVQLSIWAERAAGGWVFHATGHDLTRQRQQARVLELLAGHRRGLLLSEHPDAARRLLCSTVREAAGCEGVYLYESDGEDTWTFRLTAQSLHLAGTGAPTVTLSPRVRGLLRHVGTDGLRIARDELGTSAAADALRSTGLQTFVVRPLMRRGEAVGVLLLGWLAADRDTSTGDPQLLDVLASEATLVFERLAAQEQLRLAARTDPLTGLVNRREHDRLLEAAVQQAEEDGTALALLVLDLDRFKAYNDTHGHPGGDALLVRAAAAWTTSLDGEGWLARVGGDEFAVLLPGADAGRAAEVADRLRGATPPEVGLTVGTALHVPGASAEQLLQAADNELYASKRAR